MIEINQLLLNATEVDKNGRLFTKEAWDRVINSEQNKNHAIPVVSHATQVSDLLPVQDMVGMADCSWAPNNTVNLHMVLTDSALKNIAFVPAFEADASDIKIVDGVEVISKCDITCFFATEHPAVDVTIGD